MIAAPGIMVNGIHISIEQINAEVQYHPATSLLEAKYEAMHALVVRELLIQQALRLGLCDRSSVEASADDIIERLLERELTVPVPSEAECERYYRNNRDRFVSAPLFEVSHILFLAPPEDETARGAALIRARKCLEKVKASPESFARIAAIESGCPSAKQGGNLGQISRGQTVPAFETALFQMKEGEISREPVPTEVGYHVIRVHRRVEGRQLPFDMVKEWISEFLTQKSWQHAFSQYVQILAGQAKISGFRMKGAETPLVQ